MTNEYQAWAKAWFRRVHDGLVSATEPADVAALLAKHRPPEWTEALGRRRGRLG